jgi:hypothetical protein
VQYLDEEERSPESIFCDQSCCGLLGSTTFVEGRIVEDFQWHTLPILEVGRRDRFLDTICFTLDNSKGKEDPEESVLGEKHVARSN